MDTSVAMALTATAAVAAPMVRARLQLSRAKHPSLSGHARLARRLAKLVPYYEYGEDRFFRVDGAPPDVADRRRAAFFRLAESFARRAPQSIRATEALEAGLSDLQFTSRYRVPFQFSRYVRRHLKIGTVVRESSGVTVTDLDGNVMYDLAGSYGVNLFGYDFYKDCIDAAVKRVGQLGPVLGAYHPLVEDNVRRLRAISGLDEVSFHMSGTEAVMQAVRLARYHTGRSHVVRFCGAYHGWWDDVQAGVGNPRAPRHLYTLKDVDEASLRVLRTRRDIACVLVNPVQVMHVNAGAPGDASLVAGVRGWRIDVDAYRRWLQRLREVCRDRGIVFVLDEVFVGFRLAPGGAQEYFGVRADLVTYGKTLGGGLPVGVVCGTRRLMKRYRDDRPSDICFARGTFNSHPYVMAAMNEFLRRLDTPEVRATYAALETRWNARADDLNARLEAAGVPVRVANLASIWTVCYSAPSRYNWMFQYYLRAESLSLSWVGSGRLIFSHAYRDADFDEVARRFVAAARAMADDGWWWHAPSASERSIRRQVARELIAASLPWRRAAPHAE
jgi:glutamate-1-semialdehyde 2,1-aminomutase